MRNIFYLSLILFVFSHHLSLAQNISKTQFLIDGPIQDIVWCGQEDLGLFEFNSTDPIYMKKVVLVVSGKGTVYRSVDEGKNFENLKPKFVSLLKSYGAHSDEKNVFSFIENKIISFSLEV